MMQQGCKTHHNICNTCAPPDPGRFTNILWSFSIEIYAQSIWSYMPGCCQCDCRVQHADCYNIAQLTHAMECGMQTPVNPDVGITSTPGPLNATVGSPVSFNITITNTGQAPATNVTVTETLPPGLTFPPGWTAPAGGAGIGHSSCDGMMAVFCLFITSQHRCHKAFCHCVRCLSYDVKWHGICCLPARLPAHKRLSVMGSHVHTMAVVRLQAATHQVRC